MRYGVWRYSNSWGKWVRDIYPNIEDAEKRYERLKKRGKRAKPPQPMNTGITFFNNLNPTGQKIFIGCIALFSMLLVGIFLAALLHPMQR